MSPADEVKRGTRDPRDAMPDGRNFRQNPTQYPTGSVSSNASKSLARRRLRFNQAIVRSTAHRALPDPPEIPRLAPRLFVWTAEPEAILAKLNVAIKR